MNDIYELLNTVIYLTLLPADRGPHNELHLMSDAWDNEACLISASYGVVSIHSVV